MRQSLRNEKIKEETSSKKEGLLGKRVIGKENRTFLCGKKALR